MSGFGELTYAISGSICVPKTRQNVDLTNYGDATPGTPVAIWGRWEAENQTWRFEKGEGLHSIVSDSTLTSTLSLIPNDNV